MRVPGDRWRDRTAAQGATAEGKVGGMLRVGLSSLLELKQDSSPPQFRTSMLSLRRGAMRNAKYRMLAKVRGGVTRFEPSLFAPDRLAVWP
jgi:hypothetical protein